MYFNNVNVQFEYSYCRDCQRIKVGKSVSQPVSHPLVKEDFLVHCLVQNMVQIINGTKHHIFHILSIFFNNMTYKDTRVHVCGTKRCKYMQKTNLIPQRSHFCWELSTAGHFLPQLWSISSCWFCDPHHDTLSYSLVIPIMRCSNIRKQVRLLKFVARTQGLVHPPHEVHNTSHSK